MSNILSYRSTCPSWINLLKIFHDVVLLLEGEDRTICELYDIMCTLKTKLHQQQMDFFFQTQTRTILQQFPDQKAGAIKNNLSNSYMAALNYSTLKMVWFFRQ